MSCQLGYRAALRDVSGGQMVVLSSNSRKKLQMGTSAWGADFPTPSNYFLPVLSCRSFYGNPATTLNQAGYCNR